MPILRDLNVKVDASLFERACLPLRVALGVALLFAADTLVFDIPIEVMYVIAGAWALGAFVFAGKAVQKRTGEHWKQYGRAAVAYALVAALIAVAAYRGLPEFVIAAGLIVLGDAALGHASKQCPRGA